MTRGNESRRRIGRDRSAVSTVIGITLLIAIAIALASVGVFLFTGLAEQEQTDAAPNIAANVEWNANESFATTGGDPCTDPITVADHAEITFDAADTVNMSNVDVQVGNVDATPPSCAGGPADLSWYQTLPDQVAAGETLLLFEEQGTNTIAPGATLRIVYHSPETGESYVVLEDEVPEG